MESVMQKDMMRRVDPQNQDHREEERSEERPQQQMMPTPKPNEICNDYILQPQESDIEYEGKVYRKQEEIFRGSFGTTYMFKTEDAKFGLTKIAVKAGIPQEENS